MNEKGISIPNLRALLAFVEEGNIPSAAKALKTTHTTVRRGIKGLEGYFGCKLKEHSKKTAGPTPAAKELAIVARQSVSVLDDFRNRTVGELGAVSFAGGDSLLHLLLLPQLSKIQRAFPTTMISVSDLSTFKLIQALQNYTVDLGFLRKAALSKKPSLHYAELGTYQYWVFVPLRLHDKTEDESKVFKLPFAVIKNHWDMDFAHLAEQDHTKINVKVKCENFTQVVRLIRTGEYAGILPHYSKAVLPPNEYFEIKPEFLHGEKHEIVLAWNPVLVRLRKTTLEPFIKFAIQALKFA